MNKTDETATLRHPLQAEVGDKARLPLPARLQWLATVQSRLAGADDEAHALDIARDAAWRLGQAHAILLFRSNRTPCRLLPTAGGDLPCPELHGLCRPGPGRRPGDPGRPRCRRRRRRRAVGPGAQPAAGARRPRRVARGRHLLVPRLPGRRGQPHAAGDPVPGDRGGAGAARRRHAPAHGRPALPRAGRRRRPGDLGGRAGRRGVDRFADLARLDRAEPGPDDGPGLDGSDPPGRPRRVRKPLERHPPAPAAFRPGVPPAARRRQLELDRHADRAAVQ